MLEEEEVEDRPLELLVEPEEEADSEGEKEEDEEEVDKGMVLDGLELDDDALELLLDEAAVVVDPLLVELDGETELLEMDEEEVVDSTLLTGMEELVEVAGDVGSLELRLVLEVDEELVAGPLLPELDRTELELLVLDEEEVTAFC